MRFQGRLSVADDPGPGLPVQLELGDQSLAVTADGEKLGAFRLNDAVVEPMDGTKFALNLGREHLVFDADDASTFASVAVPAITEAASAPSGKRGLLSKFGGRRATEDTAESENGSAVATIENEDASEDSPVDGPGPLDASVDLDVPVNDEWSEFAASAAALTDGPAASAVPDAPEPLQSPGAVEAPGQPDPPIPPADGATVDTIPAPTVDVDDYVPAPQPWDGAEVNPATFVEPAPAREPLGDPESERFDIRSLAPRLVRAFDSVESGEMDSSTGQALAALAGAICDVSAAPRF